MNQKEFKVITYNIDGLPETLDLNDLPKILKPITWIYKFIKGTTIIKVNDNIDSSKKIRKIGKYFSNSGADIITVQEDFNYHDELTSELYDKYCWGTYLGGFNLSKIFKSIKWFPYPRFKADGLNLFYNVNSLTLKDEEIISWNKSSGYFDHANDKLTQKGFRRYTLTIDDLFTDIDIYTLHMDADFYHSEKCPDISKDIEARKSQIIQLGEYIKKRYESKIYNPIIIMGDMNCYQGFEWNRDIIDNNFTHEFDKYGSTVWEAMPNYNDVDRIFYINNKYSKYILSAFMDCHFDRDIEKLSDHYPLIARFIIVENDRKIN